MDPSHGPATGPRRGGRVTAVAVGGVVLIVVAAVVLWLFLAGPMSPDARAKRAVERALHDLGTSTSFADFNSRMCEQYRMPQEMVDTITRTGRQTGQDVDQLFRDQAMSKFPQDLSVAEVTVDGDDATATVRTGSGGREETVHMRHEGDEWKVCEGGVGAGSVPGR